jgi:hypothetical protein
MKKCIYSKSDGRSFGQEIPLPHMFVETEGHYLNTLLSDTRSELDQIHWYYTLKWA